MKTKFFASIVSLAASVAQGSGLYGISTDAESAIPIKWSVGLDVIWDDNTTPGGVFDGDETFSLNPYVGLSFVTTSPQTTIDVYARLGVVYYLDEPAAIGSEDTYGQARVGVNVTHRFNDRLRFTTRNALSYELEPEYSNGVASNRQTGQYLYFNSDDSVGYRWTQRFGTYTGIQLTSLTYDDVANADRFTWTLYNQFRYQLSPQSVLTSSYRYSQTDADGVASDSQNQYLLVGLEHRFSPNTILVMNTGAQLREVEGATGNDSTSPYLELALRSQVNTQFNIRGFVRYGVEDYDTVVGIPAGAVEYDERLTLRVGVTGEYQISPSLSLFGGVHLVTTSYESGNFIAGGAPAPDADETLINAYIGASLKLTEYLYGTLTYNVTNSDSDVNNRDYDRNRVSVGLRSEF